MHRRARFRTADITIRITSRAERSNAVTQSIASADIAAVEDAVACAVAVVVEGFAAVGGVAEKYNCYHYSLLDWENEKAISDVMKKELAVLCKVRG